MFSEKKIILVVSPWQNVARGLVEKLSSILGEEIVLIDASKPIARVLADGLPVFLVRAREEFGALVFDPILFIENQGHEWEKKQTTSSGVKGKKTMRQRHSRQSYRRFGNRHT